MKAHRFRGEYVNKRILIINPDETEAQTIKEHLEGENTDIYCATNMCEALHYFVKMDFCLIILDACISAEDDHNLLKAMRNSKTMPILVLSSQINHNERIHAFRAGAHAYMGQPYTLEECLAQAHTLMKMYLDLNPQSNICYTLAFGKDLIIDPSSRQVFLKGKELSFTRTEFDLLFCLASNPSRVFTREQLYDQVWSEQAVFNVDDVVKAHIKALRQKLSDSDIEYIKNVWGVGYRFHREPSNK